MATTISDYYLDELKAWRHSLIFYTNEMGEFTEKFSEVIRRNSIPQIANKVESRQASLNHLSQQFLRLQLEIEQQEKRMTTDHTYIEDNLIDNDLEKRQAELRNKMEATEKAYLNIKFDCYNFLSGIFRKYNAT